MMSDGVDAPDNQAPTDQRQDILIHSMFLDKPPDVFELPQEKEPPDRTALRRTIRMLENQRRPSRKASQPTFQWEIGRAHV